MFYNTCLFFLWSFHPCRLVMCPKLWSWHLLPNSSLHFRWSLRIWMKSRTQPFWHVALTFSSRIPSMIRLWSYSLQLRRYLFVKHPHQHMEISGHMCVPNVPVFFVWTKVWTSPGVVHYSELDHHGRAGRENDYNWCKRLVRRGPKGAAGEHSWLLHASGQLSPGNQEIHTSGHQAEGNAAVCLYGFAPIWEQNINMQICLHVKIRQC